MRRFRKWLVLIAIAWVALGMIVAVVRLAKGGGRFLYRAKFTEFFVCEGPDPSTGSPKEPLTIVPSTAKTLYACGYLEADGVVPLHFVLFYADQPVSWYDDEENYQTGYLFKELPEYWRDPGKYRVEARLQRHLVDAAKFTTIR